MDTTSDTTTTYKCRKCLIDKELSEYYKDKNSRTGHAYYCKECERARFKDRYKTNDEFKNKEKERVKRYKNNKKVLLVSDLIEFK